MSPHWDPAASWPARFTTETSASGCSHSNSRLTRWISSFRVTRAGQKDGLGKTGDTSIVGPDFLMRTNSRGFAEDPEQHVARLRARGVSEEKINRIRAYKSTALQQEVRLPSVIAALAGKEGAGVQLGSAGGRSLISYGPLRIPGLHWTIASRMDEAEALTEVDKMRSRLILWALAMMAVALPAGDPGHARHRAPVGGARWRLQEARRRRSECERAGHIKGRTRRSLGDVQCNGRRPAGKRCPGRSASAGAADATGDLAGLGSEVPDHVRVFRRCDDAVGRERLSGLQSRGPRDVRLRHGRRVLQAHTSGLFSSHATGRRQLDGNDPGEDRGCDD